MKPKQLTLVKLVFCGPSDVEKEIIIGKEIVEQWNQRHGESRGLWIKHHHWKTDTYPDLSDRAQNIPNRQLSARTAGQLGDCVGGVSAANVPTTCRRAAGGAVAPYRLEFGRPNLYLMLIHGPDVSLRVSVLPIPRESFVKGSVLRLTTFGRVVRP